MVSILQKYDYYIIVFSSMSIALSGFNSTKVRLLLYAGFISSSSHSVSILQKYDYYHRCLSYSNERDGFNSTKVRLLPISTSFNLNFFLKFQFYKSTIITKSQHDTCPLHSLFQFYKSTIITNGRQGCEEELLPFQFYKSTIITKVSASGVSTAEVSILQKYDYYDRVLSLFEQMTAFQFYKSTIITIINREGKKVLLRFNSTKVRLLQKARDIFVFQMYSFNSTKVRLLHSKRIVKVVCIVAFQFYKSTIIT